MRRSSERTIPAPSVVFLIHLAAVLDNWDPRVVDGFAAEHHVITFDNRGIAASSGAPATSIEQMATDAIAFIGTISATGSSAKPRKEPVLRIARFECDAVIEREQPDGRRPSRLLTETGMLRRREEG